MRANGFLQLRRELWEDVRDGRMSRTEGLAFIYICSQADTRTGTWKGSAKSLSSELGIPERTARDVLEKMDRGGYIRRFAVPGKHSCYPILIHKFEITDGEHNGERLDALESKSPADLAYFPREQSVERDGEHGIKAHPSDHAPESEPANGASMSQSTSRPDAPLGGPRPYFGGIRRPHVSPLGRPPDLFEKFWQAYPRKQGRGAAMRAFALLNVAEIPAVITAAENLGGSAYIPLAVYWLRDRQWDSETTGAGSCENGGAIV